MPKERPKYQIKGKFVVKVQLSLSTTETKRQLLVYNRSKTVFHQMDAPAEVIKAVGGEPKSFWLARMNGTLIELLEPVDARSW